MLCHWYYLYWTIKPHYIQNGIRLPHIIYVLSFALEDDYSSVTHFEGFNQTKFDLSSFPNIQFILLQHFVLRNPIRLFTSSTDLSINNSSYPGQSIYLKHEELKNVIWNRFVTIYPARVNYIQFEYCKRVWCLCRFYYGYKIKM